MTADFASLPSGGRFDLDAGAPAAILAHLQVLCAPDDSLQELDARSRRDALLGRLSARQRELMGVLCRGLARLAERQRPRARASL